MPTTILFWNIRDFGLNKIANPYNPAESLQRLNHITSIIKSVDPQIFIVVEVSTGGRQRGQLISTTGGRDGTVALLRFIRAATKENDWMMVPPLYTGTQEGVAVYYRATNRYFTGPNTWSGGADGITQPANLLAGAYPPDLDGGLPGRFIPAAAQYNGQGNESQMAARVNFNLSLGQQTIPMDYGNLRAPYMTTFTEVDNNGVVQRNITIFSIHSPAAHDPAEVYLAHLARLTEINSPPAANEVRVIAGDFNANVLNSTGDNLLKAAYRSLINRGYTLTINPPNNVPNPLNGYYGYFATHIKSGATALYGSTLGTTQYYPGYGYIGADLGNYFAIDNIFVKYGNGIAPAAMPDSTILNTVVGAPFNIYDPPNPQTPEGSTDLHHYMGDFYGGRDTDPPQTAPQFQIGEQNRFRGQYRQIYSVSDHFALAIDI